MNKKNEIILSIVTTLLAGGLVLAILSLLFEKPAEIAQTIAGVLAILVIAFVIWLWSNKGNLK